VAQGFASAGARELVRYGFDDVRLDRIIAQTLSVNAGSRAVMERVGLTYVRTFPSSITVPVEGVEEGEVEYEMTREQWERRAR
jgi:RimJ/RimL family protein N-acetyltransferase